MKSLSRLSAALVALSLGASAAAANEQTFITIGTGGVTGVYYPAGGALCRLVNKDRKEHGIRCSVESTGGSVYNARTVRSGELDFGVVQSDVQGDAYNGTGSLEADGPDHRVRAVFSLHPEPIHLTSRAEAEINGVQDLRGKRVNIGDPGSGDRVLATATMRGAGLGEDDFAFTTGLKSSEQAAALCDGKIDASFFGAGIPNGATMESTSTCDIRLVPLEGAWVDQVIADQPAYAKAIIPGGTYPKNEEDVASFGPRATIITTTDTPDEVVYALVKAVFENFAAFKKLHPAFATLNEQDMISKANPAPLHPGAVKYYKERGWM